MTFSNQLWGSLTILIAAGLSWLAFRSAQRQHYYRSLILIFAVGLMLRLFAGMDFHLNEWDERIHALVAKNLLHHPLVPTLYDHPVLAYDYTNWGGNHIWVHKPPLTLWLMMSSIAFFGINEIAVRLPSIILSSVGVLLTYSVGKYFFHARVGLLAGFFYAINGFLIDLATGRHPTDHPDTLFVFLIELGVFLALFYLRHKSTTRLLLIGIVTGCALLTKWLPGLIIIGLLFLLLIQEEPWKHAIAKCALVTLVAGIVAAPWQIYIFSAFPREAAWENYFNYRHIIEPLDGHTGTMLYYLALMPREFGELIYIPMILFFSLLLKKQLPSSSYVLAAWFAIPYLFFSFVATKMPGYVMISAPAVFIILSWAFWHIKENWEPTRWKIVKTVLLFLLIILPIRYSIERIKPFQDLDRNPSFAQQLRALKTTLHSPNALLFNVDHYIDAMFYTDATAYPLIPTRAQIQELRDRGYGIFIMDSPAVPAEYRNDPNVTIIRSN